MELDYIHFGDCMTLLNSTPDESVDLVVSSPPYNIGKIYEKKRALEHYLEDQKKVLAECARVLKPTGSIFWQIGSYVNNGALIPLDIKIFPILENLGMIPKNRIIWLRQHGLHANKKFSCRHETILWFTKTNDYKFYLDLIRVPQKYQNKKNYRGDKQGEYSCNPLGKNPGDIWAFRNVKHNHEEQTIHPCQFPEDLISRIVLSTTDEGDVVLDPYMGVATVAVVARDHNRHYLGAEKDEEYYNHAMRRIYCKPDQENCFPNLKTLREYVAKTGEPIENYRFVKQIGKKATEREKAKIYPEHHHLCEFENRICFEENYYSASLRGEELEDTISHKPKEQNVRHKKDGKNVKYLSLFDLKDDDQ